jgi:hypothetical protein
MSEVLNVPVTFYRSKAQLFFDYSPPPREVPGGSSVGEAIQDWKLGQSPFFEIH